MLMLVLACLAALTAEATGGEQLVSDEMCSGLFLVPLVWSGESGERHDLLAVFDTGGSRALIDPDALERASGKRVAAGARVRMSGVSMAGHTFTRFRPRVRDLDHLSLALGRQLDVFLPFQAFKDSLLMLDYPRRELRVAPGRLPEPDGVEVFSSRGPDSRPWLELRIGGRTRRLLIDSGSNGGISVRPHRGLRWATKPRPLRLTQGMADLELKRSGRLDRRLTIGSLAFPEPVVSLTKDTELLGAQVLQHFVLTFDQQQRRVRMQPVTEGPVRMPPVRGTGVLLRGDGDTFVVGHIVPGSPAVEADLQRGDRITHLDGRAAGERGCRDLEPEAAGSRIYTVKRDGRSFDVEVPVGVLLP